MSKTVFTGTQVMELLKKAVGGIYLVDFYEIPSDFLKEFSIEEDSIRFDLKNYLTLNLPISDDEYVNRAIAGEDDREEALWEVWEGSTYFDYYFDISGYSLCFNITDKGNRLTWEQFKELTDAKYGIFEIRSVDTPLYININNCTIDVREKEVEINTSGAHTIFDKSIIDNIYNDSFESESVVYRLEFNNGMSDMEIEPESKARRF